MNAGASSVTLVRRIKAPPGKVYDAWTRPDQMARWWGPDAGPVLIAEADVRRGGRFRVVFEMLDGERRDCSGVYREVEPDQRLVFTWQWAEAPDRQSLVTVEMSAVPEGTELVLTHADLRGDAARDSHAAGWRGSMDKLEAFLAAAG
ncbi:MAG TPA: SRPBCC domain-containing protein [Phenylobacterium sp.]